ncbi:MAG: FimB/Mfa2 family fimbrial subunit [Bacteroides sp.]|nr:FimB/Mfa2 family fimbrial subunit [Bacteroides sp.]
MKKKSILLWSLLAAMTLGACSEANVPTEETTGEKGKVAFTVNFAGTVGTRAASSTAVPETSWANIKSLQFFLYDASGVIKYSDATVSTDFPASIAGDMKQFTYTDVPVGTYTLVVVANATGTAIDNYIGGSVEAWNAYNVRQKNISNMLLKYKGVSFPSYATVAGSTAYAEPTEIFMGEASAPITITSGGSTNASIVSLKREVSLLRVRMNVKDTDAGVVNENTTNGVDFTQNASILIYRLPDNMKIGAGTAGGVSITSTVTNILTIADSPVFNTSNPSSGYSTTNIIDGTKFTMWKDVVVFPNYGGRSTTANPTAAAATDRQYFIVVSGFAKEGHKLQNGNLVPAGGATVYWSGLIKENFVPNVIREVNLTLKSGGTTDIPTTPREEGELIIDLGAPEACDGNIVNSDITL